LQTRSTLDGPRLQAAAFVATVVVVVAVVAAAAAAAAAAGAAVLRQALQVFLELRWRRGKRYKKKILTTPVVVMASVSMSRDWARVQVRARVRTRVRGTAAPTLRPQTLLT
jgi:hypothetical protein